MKVATLFFLCLCSLGFSQEKGKIYFRNGTSFEGTMSIDKPVSTGDGPTRIFYSPTKDTQLIKGFDDIYRVDQYLTTEGKKDTITFYFKKYKNREMFLSKLESYKTFEVYIGYVYQTHHTENSFGFGISTGQTETIEEFYIAKKYSFRLEKLNRRVASKKFNAMLSKYTNACNNAEALIEKYQKNKKLEKRALFAELKTICN